MCNDDNSTYDNGDGDDDNYDNTITYPIDKK